MNVSYEKYNLNFKFEAGTSRGTLKNREVFIIKISSEKNYVAYGECGTLKGLSIDDRADYEAYLKQVCASIDGLEEPKTMEEAYSEIIDKISRDFPSIIFGFETAFLDLMYGGNKVIFNNGFSRGERHIRINGLIWMGKKEFMLQQVKEKLEEGYSCIKMKIGAIKFEEELSIIKFIRDKYGPEDMIIRVDANGAFGKEDAMDKLHQLSKYSIHSIEQPVKPGQHDLMRFLNENSPVPVALDEELIGKHSLQSKTDLLEKINPQYIILKPSLLGGFKACEEWIDIAERLKIGWWVTSALESNIGLNAIAQFSANFSHDIIHGLGTGKLYLNNFGSPLYIKNGYLCYDVDKEWDINF